jgi:hypothetical protein
VDSPQPGTPEGGGMSMFTMIPMPCVAFAFHVCCCRRNSTLAWRQLPPWCGRKMRFRKALPARFYVRVLTYMLCARRFATSCHRHRGIRAPDISVSSGL